MSNNKLTKQLNRNHKKLLKFLKMDKPKMNYNINEIYDKPMMKQLKPERIAIKLETISEPEIKKYIVQITWGKFFIEF